MPHPDSDAIIREAIRLRTSGDPNRSLELLEALLQERPGDLIAYIEAGQASFAASRFDAAIAWYEHAERIAPRNFWSYYQRAEVFMVQGRHEEAVSLIKVALERCEDAISDNEYIHLVKRSLDVMALYQEAQRPTAPSFAAAPPVPGRPLPGALQVTVVKDAEDIIFACLDASYKAGIRNFAIADNGSSDSTTAEIQRFRSVHPDTIVFILSDPLVGHFQAAKTMGLTHMAATTLRSLNIELDWIFPLDADELIYVDPASGDLAGLLLPAEAASKTMLAYYHYNAGSSDLLDSLPAGADVTNMLPRFAKLDCTPVRKVAFRMSASAYIEEGNHFCNGVALRPQQILNGAALGVFLRHYPVRSLKQLRSKVMNGAKSIEAITNANIGAHWRADALHYAQQGDAYLLKRLRDYNARVATP